MKKCGTCKHWHNGPCLILNAELDGYNDDPDIIGWNVYDMVYGELKTGKDFGCTHWREDVPEQELKLFQRGICIASHNLSGNYINGDTIEIKWKLVIG